MVVYVFLLMDLLHSCLGAQPAQKIYWRLSSPFYLTINSCNLQVTRNFILPEIIGAALMPYCVCVCVCARAVCSFRIPCPCVHAHACVCRTTCAGLHYTCTNTMPAHCNSRQALSPAVWVGQPGSCIVNGTVKYVHAAICHNSLPHSSMTSSRSSRRYPQGPVKSLYIQPLYWEWESNKLHWRYAARGYGSTLILTTVSGNAVFTVASTYIYIYIYSKYIIHLTYIYTYIHTYIHKYLHKYIHTYIHKPRAEWDEFGAFIEKI